MQGIAVATVTVEGTGLSARSADDGAYRIANVPPGSHTVRAARIGFTPVSKPVTVVADQDSTVDFTLTAQATELEQVVAIGYGTAARRELTGAVSSVTADQIAAAPVTSLEQSLLGRASGVQVVTSSGQPGAGAMVRIRGGNSISAGNDPLYVIDGVPITTNLNDATTGTLFTEGMRGLNPLAALNSGDIESIEILKDASAGAIYGARGANGVVLITTKHGRSGQNTVSFGSYYARQEVRRELPLMAATQFAQMVNAAPTLSVTGPGGEYFTGINLLTGRSFENPVASALQITNQERQNRLIGNVFGEYDLLEGLTLRSTLDLDFLNSVQDYYAPSTVLPGLTTNGQGSRGQAQTVSWTFENTIHYTRRFGTLHNLDLLAGTTLERINTEGISGTAQDFLTDGLGVNGLYAGKTFVGVWTPAPHSSLASSFARANWGVADKYLFTLTGRVDGSSRFGRDHRYGLFPSGAFAWRASDEGFVRRLGWFDDLKLRVSYGRTGNQDIGNYKSLATLGSTVYVFGGSRAIGFVPASLANSDLKWETTDQVDVGVDASVLRNRVSVTADFYNKKTHDLLLDARVPSSSGFGSQLQNIGSVRNRGFELGSNTVNLTGSTLGWETSLALAWNRQEVANLGADSIIIDPYGVGGGAHQSPTVLKVGEPINSFYGWVYDSLANGQPVYKDLDGDGVITSADRTIIGNAQPT